MKGCLKGCLGRILMLVVTVVGLGYAALRWGPEYAPQLQAMVESVPGLEGLQQRVRGAVESQPEEALPEPTPEIADAVLDRLTDFRTEGAGVEMTLDGLQLTSLLRHGVPDFLPEEVGEPRITMEGDRVTLSASVPLRSLEALPSLEAVIDRLPEAVTIRLRGTVSVATPGHAMLFVDRAQAGVEPVVIPLPSRAVPELLRILGREAREGLAPNAMLFQLPDGLESAYVREDRLVLTSGR